MDYADPSARPGIAPTTNFIVSGAIIGQLEHVAYDLAHRLTIGFEGARRDISGRFRCIDIRAEGALIARYSVELRLAARERCGPTIRAYLFVQRPRAGRCRVRVRCFEAHCMTFSATLYLDEVIRRARLSKDALPPIA